MNQFAPPFFIEKRPFVVAGPCSAESREQVMETCQSLADSGKIDALRCGIWKPRTRPDTFEGIGEEGLSWMQEAKEATGLPLATEVANTHHIERAMKAGIDILWIGARTTVNPFSVQEIADALKGSDVTVLVKNPIHADVELWTGAVERFQNAGLNNLGLIHRGFAQHRQNAYRNEPKWQLAVEMKRRFPRLPLICDPSHIAGERKLIQEIAQQALDLDFDGLMIESHIDPDRALSDKKQQLVPADLVSLLNELVVREAAISDEELILKMELLRKQIDVIDEELVKLLGDRMKVAEEIGLIKREKGITILQRERWEEIIAQVQANGQVQGLSKKFLTSYLNAIHQESIEHQSEVMNQADLQNK
ncbi:MAG: bifunctional 3-deoxy-7-phosphoheptulonate synthase/chorismate mutase type II [Ekhidna sp.]